MNWRQALKQYNDGDGGQWVIPKKGTEQYDEVRKLG